ncbi:MAG: hypothetical protein ACQESR_22580 [Planctomycetota bacterium]
MQVKIKSFDVNMDVKSKGIEFEVRKPGGSAQVGDCYLTMTGLIWCEGKKAKTNGLKISWDEFQEIMKSAAAKKAALEAAKLA